MITEQIKPYEILIRFGEDGEFRGAQTQCIRRILEGGVVISAALLPPAVWGADSNFPLGPLDAITEAALTAAVLATAEGAAALVDRDAAIAARDTAISSRDAAISSRDTAAATAAVAAAEAAGQIAAQAAQITALAAQPTRPPGKWWPSATALLQEFLAAELIAIRKTDLPEIAKWHMILLSWRGEILSSDALILDGFADLFAAGILTSERSAAILS